MAETKLKTWISDLAHQTGKCQEMHSSPYSRMCRLCPGTMYNRRGVEGACQSVALKGIHLSVWRTAKVRSLALWSSSWHREQKALTTCVLFYCRDATAAMTPGLSDDESRYVSRLQTSGSDVCTSRTHKPSRGR